MTLASASSRISFRNWRAVAVSIVVATIALIGMGFVSLLSPLLAPFALCGAGFLTVIIYRRQSPQDISTIAGARLGWMTGLWLFLITFVGLALFAFYISSPSGLAALRAATNVMPNPDLAKILNDPHEFLASIPREIAGWFLTVTLLPGLGGMLAAKFPPRVRNQSLKP
jgi:ABC-type phosphate transport system permease subunit